MNVKNYVHSKKAFPFFSKYMFVDILYKDSNKHFSDASFEKYGIHVKGREYVQALYSFEMGYYVIRVVNVRNKDVATFLKALLNQKNTIPGEWITDYEKTCKRLIEKCGEETPQN